MKLLAAIADEAGLAPIDLHFAELMRRRATAETADAVALTAALLSRERGRGHSCIDLGDWAGRSLLADGRVAGPELPGREVWERQLSRSGLVGDPDRPAAEDATPLVRDAGGRLYLRRYFLAERRVAEALRQRLLQPRSVAARFQIEGETQDLFRKLFPDAGSEAGAAAAGATAAGATADGQAAAAAAALSGPVTLISGGPGTGKTTTVTRILALLLAADPELRIALAAPTGKAASRLGESIADQLATLPVTAELRALIPSRASTLHRLLGYLPRHDRFRHHSGRPLACDVLVVDEASMVDLLMMDAALTALPDTARVILLGDRDQLASVETGFVFGDLCAAAVRPDAGALAAATVELRKSYRFQSGRGIGALASAIRDQDAAVALDVLADGGRPDVDRRDPPPGPAAAEARDVLAPLLGDLEHYLAATSPSQALRRLGRFRILCATRQGPWGVEGLGALAEQELLRRGLLRRGLPVTDRWYHGRPILITANDYQVKLFNGDLGICWAEGDRLYAWFSAGGDETGLRRLPLARVPAHATAWAMTVHKSQGSEFDRVLLTLPEADMPLLTRELLYTGVTRAREHLHLVATAGVLRAAISRRSRRASGLSDALLGREPSPAAPPEPSAAKPAVRAPEQLRLF